jgi:hypothetical protein
MRQRIERERVHPVEAGTFHFKLGHGSLADVQFAVELALMAHGGARPEVRRRRTLDAIEALASARVMEDASAHALGEAFVFLSGVKNALEMDRRVPAEAIPPSPQEQVALARRLGVRSIRGSPSSTTISASLLTGTPRDARVFRDVQGRAKGVEEASHAEGVQGSSLAGTWSIWRWRSSWAAFTAVGPRSPTWSWGRSLRPRRRGVLDRLGVHRDGEIVIRTARSSRRS